MTISSLIFDVFSVISWTEPRETTIDHRNGLIPERGLGDEASSKRCLLGPSRKRQMERRTRENKSVTRFRGRTPANRSRRRKVRSWVNDGLEQQERNKGDKLLSVQHAQGAPPSKADACMVLGWLIFKPAKTIISHVYRCDNIFSLWELDYIRFHVNMIRYSWVCLFVFFSFLTRWVSHYWF